MKKLLWGLVFFTGCGPAEPINPEPPACDTLAGVHDNVFVKSNLHTVDEVSFMTEQALDAEVATASPRGGKWVFISLQPVCPPRSEEDQTVVVTKLARLPWVLAASPDRIMKIR